MFWRLYPLLNASISVLANANAGHPQSRKKRRDSSAILHLQYLGCSNILVYMFCQSWHVTFRYIWLGILKIWVTKRRNSTHLRCFYTVRKLTTMDTSGARLLCCFLPVFFFLVRSGFVLASLWDGWSASRLSRDSCLARITTKSIGPILGVFLLMWTVLVELLKLVSRLVQRCHQPSARVAVLSEIIWIMVMDSEMIPPPPPNSWFDKYIMQCSVVYCLLRIKCPTPNT